MKTNNISADKIIIGSNTVISPGAIIRGLNGPAKRVEIGDNCFIGDSVQIIIDDFCMGDYGKIHHHANLHGYMPMKIGHNAWIGQGTIIDSVGGVEIGNNVGIGAYSQLWSHIKYGDVSMGCNYFSEKKLEIHDNVWLVGHCIVSPVIIGKGSMALVGSVITKDMKEDHIYGGSPARDLTNKIPAQFNYTKPEDRYQLVMGYLEDFNKRDNIQICLSTDDFIQEDDITYFDVTSMTYTKKYHKNEILFMRYLLPEKAKFIPFNWV